MGEFLLAYAAFLAAHVLPAATGLRARLVARLGRGVYVALYSLLSIGLLAWLIDAALRAPFLPLWPQSQALALVPFLAMPVACILLVAGARRANPVSVAFRSGDAAEAKTRADPGLLALTDHPILWAFALWALAHAIANGDLVAVLLFGGFALFAFAGMAALSARARRRGARGLAQGPLLARLRRAATPGGLLDAALGLALFALLLALHGPVIGRDPTLWL